MLLNWVCGVWCRLASSGLSPVFCWFSGFPNDTPGRRPLEALATQQGPYKQRGGVHSHGRGGKPN